MTGARDELVAAAVQAWHCTPDPSPLDDEMRAVLAAVLPLLTADDVPHVREQIAQEIEADAAGREEGGLQLVAWAMRDAAKIAGGGS